jgi:hypothetical protein
MLKGRSFVEDKVNASPPIPTTANSPVTWKHKRRSYPIIANTANECMIP